MKLIIQIPCFNEESSLPITVSELPRKLPGVDVVEYLIVDDGSTDRTVEVARSLGIHHVVRLPKNKGLAHAFVAGLEESLRLGADLIVNTDADNQYFGGDIEKLIEPILSGRAEFVIGTRPIMEIAHFSRVKKVLQKFGSWAVRIASKTDVLDAPSGFRAWSRNAAIQMNVFSAYTYTLETIIQAGRKGIAIETVAVRTNGDLRPSRLVKSISQYVYRSILTIVRIFIVYQPLRFFISCGLISFTFGLMISCRFLYYFFSGSGQGHLQSLMLALLLMLMGFVGMIAGILSDLISVNRRLIEKMLKKVYEIEELVRKHSQ